MTARIILEQTGSGVATDARFIECALQQRGVHVEIVYYKKKMFPLTVPVHLQIFIEHVFVQRINITFPAQKSFLLVNPEVLADWDFDALKKGTITALSKTRFACDFLRRFEIEAQFIGFGNPLPTKVENTSMVQKIPGCVIHIAGKSSFQGTEILVKAWRTYVDDKITEGELHKYCSINRVLQYSIIYQMFKFI